MTEKKGASTVWSFFCRQSAFYLHWQYKRRVSGWPNTNWTLSAPTSSDSRCNWLLDLLKLTTQCRGQVVACHSSTSMCQMVCPYLAIFVTTSKWYFWDIWRYMGKWATKLNFLLYFIFTNAHAHVTFFKSNNTNMTFSRQDWFQRTINGHL